MLAAGDYVTAYGAYGVGAAGRVLGNLTSDTANAAASAAGKGGNASGGFGDARWALYDATVNTAGGSPGVVKLSTTYSFGAELKHYFTPAVAAYVGGSYGNIAYGAGKQSSSISEFAPHNANMYNIVLGAIWSPVKGLEINPEFTYRKSSIKADNGVVDGNRIGKNDDGYMGRIRVARSF